MFLDKAIVLGGGITGLLCSLESAKVFKKVKLIRNNKVPYQGVHTHLLLSSGYSAISQILKSSEISDLRVFDVGQEIRWENEFGPLRSFPTSLKTVSVSHTDLLSKLNQLLELRENIEVLECDSANSFRVGKNNKIIEIVIKKGKKLCNETGTFYFDCTGARGLMKSIYKPETQVSQHGSWYATMKGDFSGDLNWSYFLRSYDEKNPIGTIARHSESSLELTLTGKDKLVRPPKCKEDFLGMASKVISKELIDGIVLDQDKPSIAYPLPNQLKLFSKCNLPNNLVPLGDSIGSTNPHFGRGISLAALSVLNAFKQIRSSVDQSEVSNITAKIISSNEHLYSENIKRVIQLGSDDQNLIDKYTGKAFWFSASKISKSLAKVAHTDFHTRYLK